MWRKAVGHRDVSSPEPQQELRVETDPAAKLVRGGLRKGTEGTLQNLFKATQDIAARSHLPH